jgi:serine protease Do
MNSRHQIPGLLLSLACIAAPAASAKDVIIRHTERQQPRIVLVDDKERPAREMETVAFLGVETTPVPRTVAKHLGLARDMGLIVERVAKDSPAATVLQEDDILTKLDDQLLIDSRQFTVLIRSKKEGDEIKLTFLRAGKEQTARVKLGKKEVPKVADAFQFFGAPLGQGPLFPPDAFQQGVVRLKDLSGAASEEVQEMVRRLQRERGSWFGTPGVRVITRGGKGSTILDLPRGHLTYSDDDGSIEVQAEDGKRQLTVKDKDGKVTFEGPINSEEDRKKLPDDVKKRIEKIEFSHFNFEPGDEFEIEAGKVSEPGRSKISGEPARRSSRPRAQSL